MSWNTRELLARCLASVAEDLGDSLQPSPSNNEPGAQVWVVDNASSDGSAAMVRERFPWVHLIANEENVGFAAANNQVIRQSQARYVVLLNSDTEVRPGAFQALVEFMDTHPQAGACGARLLNADGSLQPSCHPMLTPDREFWRLLFLDRFFPQATYRMERWDVTTPRRVEVIKGACLLLRRAAMGQVGLLDEGYFMYTEEVDLCYRLARAGWQLWWVPQAQVVHFAAQSTRLVAERMYVQLYRSKVQFYRKFGGERRAARFKRWLWLAYTLRLAATRLGALLSPSLAAQVRLYRRMLAELPEM